MTVAAYLPELAVLLALAGGYSGLRALAEPVRPLEDWEDGE